MDAAGVGFSNYPTMSSRYGDFARDAHHQQSSSAYSQRRNMHDYDCCLVFFLSCMSSALFIQKSITDFFLCV
jgi:hypothetical protein